MLECSEVKILHHEGSSFCGQMYKQEPHSMIYVTDNVVDHVNRYEYVAKQLGVYFRASVIETGTTTEKTWSSPKSFKQITQLTILDEQDKNIKDGKRPLSMWRLNLQPIDCITKYVAAFNDHFFSGQCGILNMYIVQTDYVFSIRAPAGKHIRFMMDRYMNLCRLLCSYGSSMQLIEGNLKFRFTDASWKTEWSTMTSEAKFLIKVHRCRRLIAHDCIHVFRYRVHNNREVQAIEHSTSDGTCRIASSEYKVVEANSWNDAKYACGNDWQLLSITDREESNAILAHAATHPTCRKYWGKIFTKELVFIGLHKVTTAFVII